MTDVYLCNNRSTNDGDVTLRGVNACSVATVTTGGGGRERRDVQSWGEPTRRRSGSIGFSLILWGRGSIEAAANLSLATTVEAESAGVAAAGDHTFKATMAADAAAVTASSHLGISTELAAIYPDDDELLELLELIGGTP